MNCLLKNQIELREAHANLLESAGYDRAAYIKWVDDGELTAIN